MNLNKHISFFNPANIKSPIHIIGCGALGSHIAEQLVRLGCDNITLWDMDTVSAHNITNQMFRYKDIGKSKTEALQEILLDINPNLKLKLKGEYKEQNLAGFIFMMVDSIELRQKFVKQWTNNMLIKAVFDGRMRLTDAQAYAANWLVPQDKADLLSTMNFTSEEAKAATPVSACGTSLSVTPTVKVITSLIVSNFINFNLKNELSKIIIVDAFEYNLISC